MTTQPPAPPASTPANWKLQTYLLGALIGLALGLLTAYFFARASEEHGRSGPSPIKTLDALKLSVSVLGIIRQITDLGASAARK